MNIITNLKNPRHSVYKLSDVTRRVLPVPLARLLAIGNRTALPGYVDLPTYDGSGQACHPSTAVFNGTVYMACTPYPYGNEYYENPSLYLREPGSRRWRPVPGAFPLVRPRRLRFEHYSDPCLFPWGRRLVLLFRKCERRPEGTVDLLYTASSQNGADWTAPRLLAEGKGNGLISPAAAGGGLFCVEFEAGDTRIARYRLDDPGVLGERTPCGVSGLDQDFFVWHIDCATLPDGTVRGLFMLRKKSTPETVSRLSLFTWRPEERTWSRDRDLPMSEAEGKAVRYVYKSCFTEDPARVLCSACDRRGRYFLYEKQIEEDL